MEKGKVIGLKVILDIEFRAHLSEEVKLDLRTKG